MTIDKDRAVVLLNPEIRTVSQNSSGNEGQTIIGTDYIPGISGIDSATEALEVISYEHHEIHSGSHYFICGYQSFSNGQVVDFTFVTPDTTTWTHMVFFIEGTDAISLDIYEGATVSVEGTAVTPRNNDRNSADSSINTVRSGDTLSGTGTLISSQYAGANNTAGKVSRDNEIILKQNETYIFRITNQAATPNNISYCAEWYEHTNKN